MSNIVRFAQRARAAHPAAASGGIAPLLASFAHHRRQPASHLAPAWFFILFMHLPFMPHIPMPRTLASLLVLVLLGQLASCASTAPGQEPAQLLGRKLVH